MNLMTIMYISVQETLNDPDGMSLTYEKLRMFRLLPCSLFVAVPNSPTRFTSVPEPVSSQLHVYGHVKAPLGRTGHHAPDSCKHSITSKEQPAT